jgi:ACS family tartrate transporter-like MFS transporter
MLLKAERAVTGRLLPPLLLLVIISYLDRTALSFASIQMSHDLNLSSSMYGLGSGAYHA